MGILLSLMTLFFGFGMEGVFGAAKEVPKNDLKSLPKAAPPEIHKADDAKMSATIEKACALLRRPPQFILIASIFR